MPSIAESLSLDAAPRTPGLEEAPVAYTRFKAVVAQTVTTASGEPAGWNIYVHEDKDHSAPTDDQHLVFIPDKEYQERNIKAINSAERSSRMKLFARKSWTGRMDGYVLEAKEEISSSPSKEKSKSGQHLQVQNLKNQ